MRGYWKIFSTRVRNLCVFQISFLSLLTFSLNVKSIIGICNNLKLSAIKHQYFTNLKDVNSILLNKKKMYLL